MSNQSFFANPCELSAEHRLGESGLCCLQLPHTGTDFQRSHNEKRTAPLFNALMLASTLWHTSSDIVQTTSNQVSLCKVKRQLGQLRCKLLLQVLTNLALIRTKHIRICKIDPTQTPIDRYLRTSDRIPRPSVRSWRPETCDSPLYFLLAAIVAT